MSGPEAASRDTTLTAAEEQVAAEVRAILGEVADEFARALADASELVAARFSVSGIARMWAQRVPRLVRRLLSVAETAAETAADDVALPLPDGWDDLPGRWDDDRLPASLGDYATTTEYLLRAVGDRLSDAAVQALAAGLDAGEDIDQLRARLRAVFARTGAELGPVREERIARTEAARAWNTATTAAAQDLTAPDRPLVKQWVTRHDERVRHAHSEVDGQLRLLDEPFTVAGVSMQHPGDPTAPPELVINCRCILKVAPEHRASAFESQVSSPSGLSDQRLTAAVEHSGVMIALLPAADDAERLALDGGEPADELHCTLWFLGEAADWNPAQRAELIDGIRTRAATLLGPVPATLFGVNHWNPASDDPAWVWAVGDMPDADDEAPHLQEARWVVLDALENVHERPDTPHQHSPWVAHVTGAYTTDTWPLAAMTEADRLGPITFDRIRVAFGGEYTDIPLGTPQEEESMPTDQTAAATTAAAIPAPRPWSTPDGAGLAFENQQTGDSRVFAPGALYWGKGPWPLQHAEEMLMAHEGARLAASIQHVARDGDRITASGLLYPSLPAGADALMHLEEGAPLGVSVDLDDVDVEFVRAKSEEDEEESVLAASLAQMSVLRLEDGAWSITAHSRPEWTAAGTTLTRSRHDVQLITGPGGHITAAAVRTAFAGAPGVLTAAAGDPDDPDAVVLHSESSGDLLLRITRARLRGATLVAMPAFADARIVLDPVEDEDSEVAAAVRTATVSDTHHAVVAHVSASPVPVGAREVAQAVGITMGSARGHLSRAAEAGRIVRLAPGLYVGPSTLPEGGEVSAAVGDGRPPQPGHSGERGSMSLGELEASAWTAMRDVDPMPAAWFREPTPEELPPGSGGVHYADGRIYGWVAQAGEPHAGYPNQRLTIESLGELDLTHFLRAQFRLDDGTLVRAGAFTMNTGHHRDGAECETAACQFDDTRTVAGIVTVGMNAGGLWFSGAAAPWLGEWDRKVFAACQPSYHMKQGEGGRWQLRAVLSVPVPGHSSPLLAAAVAERANLALAASAATSPPPHAPDDAGQVPPAPAQPAPAPAPVPSDLTEALSDPAFLDGLADALARREAERERAARDELARLTALVAPAREEITASAAGPAPKGAR